MTEYDDTFDRMADRIESLEKQLADEREQHIRTRGQRNERYESSRANYDEVNQLRQQLADLQSQPRLQRVTPESMAELESRNATGVLIMSRDWLYHCSYTSDRGWIRHDDYANALIPGPARGWFIIRAELPEVTQ